MIKMGFYSELIKSYGCVPERCVKPECQYSMYREISPRKRLEALQRLSVDEHNKLFDSCKGCYIDTIIEKTDKVDVKLEMLSRVQYEMQ